MNEPKCDGWQGMTEAGVPGPELSRADLGVRGDIRLLRMLAILLRTRLEDADLGACETEVNAELRRLVDGRIYAGFAADEFFADDLKALSAFADALGIEIEGMPR